MTSIGIRQLRADLAANVRRARAGDSIVVTLDGRPAAHLGPLPADDGQVRLADLIARGLVVAPRRRDDYRAGEPIRVWAGSRIEQLMRDLRG